ncbi:MAG: hypothetical protein H6964_09715 [Chromatiaceae bacterium]|nr:hypothetical protein [Gammaproteobacteria bacterium]MCB1903901.1 hypothetical protein [Gammaproteobacteria bacterium]MCP5427963.1 hypothetical protein [Chromatiaceae bacterium]MCP5447261.1 hypothetical protein [Chromatiaceae bacterium]
MKTRSKCHSTRLLIAHEAAKMLANQESWDFQSARRKAADRLGCKDQRCFPDNVEIEAALRAYQQLFKVATQPEVLRQLRLLAVEAMQRLHAFSPRLTGAVLDGTADSGSPVQLYLFADTAEDLTLHLMEKRIPFDQRELRLRHAGGKTKTHPLFVFQAGDAEIKLILLSPSDRADPPLDTRTDTPNPGASLVQAKALLDS